MNYRGLKTTVSRGVMMSDVILDYPLGHPAHSADEIPIGPEAIPPINLFQLREFLANLVRSAPFDQVHDLSRGIAWLGREQQMDMIRLNAQLQDLELIDLSAEVKHCLQALLEPALQDTFVIFRDPDEVILDVISGIGGFTNHDAIISGGKPAVWACSFPLRS